MRTAPHYPEVATNNFFDPPAEPKTRGSRSKVDPDYQRGLFSTPLGDMQWVPHLAESQMATLANCSLFITDSCRVALDAVSKIRRVLLDRAWDLNTHGEQVKQVLREATRSRGGDASVARRAVHLVALYQHVTAPRIVAGQLVAAPELSRQPGTRLFINNQGRPRDAAGLDALLRQAPELKPAQPFAADVAMLVEWILRSPHCYDRSFSPYIDRVFRWDSAAFPWPARTGPIVWEQLQATDPEFLMAGDGKSLVRSLAGQWTWVYPAWRITYGLLKLKCEATGAWAAHYANDDFRGMSIIPPWSGKDWRGLIQGKLQDYAVRTLIQTLGIEPTDLIHGVFYPPGTRSIVTPDHEFSDVANLGQARVVSPF